MAKEEISVFQFFEELATDMEGNYAQFEKHAKMLKDKHWIKTLGDVELLEAEQWDEVGLPQDVVSFIKAKFGLVTVEPTRFGHKEAIILYQTDYSQLRKAKGLSGMEDIPQAAKDADNAAKIAKSLGVEDKNIHRLTNITSKEFNSHIMKTMKRFSAKAIDGDIPFLFVYCAGHGCADM